MSLSRQGRWYVIVGLAQLLLDWATFVGLTALGVPAAPGNLAGRVAGALLGFWLNGRITFAQDGEARLGRVRLLRFALAWLVLTLVSTWLVAFIAGRAGLGQAWLAKPVVDAGLAAVGFLVSRHWVYR